MKERQKSILGLAIAAVLWSTGGLFIKLIDMNPIAIAGIRSGIAAIVMMIYLKKPKIHFNKITILASIVYALLLLTFVGANKLTTAANAIFLQYTSPIWTIIFAHIILKEKIRRSDITTICAVICGMALFFIDSFSGGSLLGNGIALLSGLFQVGLIIFTKMKTDGSAIEIPLLGNMITFIVSIPFIPHSSPGITSISMLLVLGVIQCGISYIFYMNSIRQVTSVEAILIPVLEPLLNPVWVFLFVGEKMSSTTILGGAIVICSILWNEVVIGKRTKLDFNLALQNPE